MVLEQQMVIVTRKKELRMSIRADNDLFLEFDVNASVPRLNSSMNLGFWNSDEKDMYKSIFKKCYPDEEFTNSARDAMKELLLRAYFERTTELLTRDI